jgi:hypothetical protein
VLLKTLFVEEGHVFTEEVSTFGRSNVRGPSLPEKQGSQRCCGMVRLPLPAPIEERARQRLLENCPYVFYFKCVTFQFKGGVLTVRGRVPTFYLKQIVQTRLRDLDGVRQIDNQVDVVSATGLSTEPRIDPLE